MTVRMDPFLGEFDRLAQSAFGQLGRPMQWSMPMDVVRREGSVSVTFDLPGIEPSSIDVTLENNVLTVHATRSLHYAEGEQLLVHERPSGEITRKVTLGDWADGEHVDASYTDGVLTVEIPVREQAKPRRIEIRQSAKQLTT